MNNQPTPLPQTLPNIWKKLGWTTEQMKEQCQKNNWIYSEEVKPKKPAPTWEGTITFRPYPENRFILNAHNKNFAINEILTHYRINKDCLRCQKRKEVTEENE